MEAAITSLVMRLQEDTKQRKLAAKEQLLLTLHAQYGADVGVLAALFLNFIQLKAGQVSTEKAHRIRCTLVPCMFHPIA